MPSPVQFNTNTPEVRDVQSNAGMFSKAIAPFSKLTATLKSLATQLGERVSQNLSDKTKHNLDKILCYVSPKANARLIQSDLGKLQQHLQQLKPGLKTHGYFPAIDHERDVIQQKRAISAIHEINKWEESISNYNGLSAEGIINQSYIEHFCGIRYYADALVPSGKPRHTEQHTAVLGKYPDPTMGMINNELSIIKALRRDIEGAYLKDRVSDDAKNKLNSIEAVLVQAVETQNRICASSIYGNDQVLSKGSEYCMDLIKNLPVGHHAIIPLVFEAFDGQSYEGHATYLLVEKCNPNGVNFHMVNRGYGFDASQRLPGQNQGSVNGQPKIQSALSKWNVPVTNGNTDTTLNKHFFENILKLTLDRNPDGTPFDYSDALLSPMDQMDANIKGCYKLIRKLDSLGSPPPGYEPIVQRTQKDGNCMYSNLKGAMRHLISDQMIYNEIDQLKTQKVAKLFVKYMNELLPKGESLTKARFDRLLVDCGAAAEKIKSKLDKAESRIAQDWGYAINLDEADKIYGPTR